MNVRCGWCADEIHLYGSSWRNASNSNRCSIAGNQFHYPATTARCVHCGQAIRLVGHANIWLSLGVEPPYFTQHCSGGVLRHHEPPIVSLKPPEPLLPKDCSWDERQSLRLGTALNEITDLQNEIAQLRVIESDLRKIIEDIKQKNGTDVSEFTEPPTKIVTVEEWMANGWSFTPKPGEKIRWNGNDWTVTGIGFWEADDWFIEGTQIFNPTPQPSPNAMWYLRDTYIKLLLPSVGEIWHWQPMLPHASQRMEVVRVLWSQTEQDWFVTTQSESGARHTNDLPGFLHSAVLVTPAPGEE